MKKQVFVVMFCAFSLLCHGMGIKIKHQPDKPSVYNWGAVCDRVWIGPEFWANRLQDWRINNGRLESVSMPLGKGMRTVHLLTKRLSKQDGVFVMEVRTGFGVQAGQISPDLSCGFLVGAAPDVDYRAAALVHSSSGKGGGIYAGIAGNGKLFIDDFENPEPPVVVGGQEIELPKEFLLRLTYSKGILQIGAYDLTGKNRLAAIDTDKFNSTRFVGGIALVSNPGKNNKATAWFHDFSVIGSKTESHPGRNCGPILCTQYTVDKDILKLTAQMMPLGEKDNQSVTLEKKTPLGWKPVATTKIIVPGWTAPFRVENWDSSRDVQYRVAYELKDAAGRNKRYVWGGTIRKDPKEKETIVVAGFTGNHMVRHPGVDRGKYTWNKDWLWFPHNDIVEAVLKHQPDLLFFSGDQVYEGNSPTCPDYSGNFSSYLDYMYKWYLYCWAYRDMLKDIPCVCIPDDHDVFQGNLWGAGGSATDKDDKGGYIMPADWVKMAERTQTSHLPDPYDPTPIEQGIGVYYTDLNVGGISFSILEDRKFKSGPNGLCPKTSSPRADHIIDPNFDPKRADVAGAKLLGDRQLKFLQYWAADWDDVEMKATLTQTIFAGAATHHGSGTGMMYLVADYDSNAWPQTGRNKALREIRKGFGFMIGGDQHLATIVHHGVDTWDDAGWSFCVPSVANFYPRKWAPLTEPFEKVDAPQEFTGRYKDGLDNHVTTWAHTNPRKMGHEPTELHDKMPGYGIVKFNKKDRTIVMECWPRFADPADPKAKQYTGWPKTITQMDNYSRKAAGYLPRIETNIDDPIVRIIHEKNNEIVYTLRIKGRKFEPKVFEDGTYTIQVGPSSGSMKTLKGVESQAKVHGSAKFEF